MVYILKNKKQRQSQGYRSLHRVRITSISPENEYRVNYISLFAIVIVELAHATASLWLCFCAAVSKQIKEHTIRPQRCNSPKKKFAISVSCRILAL